MNISLINVLSQLEEKLVILLLFLSAVRISGHYFFSINEINRPKLITVTVM